MPSHQPQNPSFVLLITLTALSLFGLPSLARAQPGAPDAPSTQPATHPAPPPETVLPAKPSPAIVAPTPAPAAPAKKKKSIPLEAFYSDGFGLRTPERSLELKVGGSAQLDARFYEGDSVAPHSFDIRRARLDFQARLFERFAVRIQAALEDGTPYIRNAFGDLRIWDFLHIRGGQMKVPFSSTWLAFDNQVDFMERPVDVPLYPFFDRGGMLWGTLLGERITYALGLYTGAGVDVDYPKGDNDNNKDFAWRLFLQPFRETPLALLEGLYLVGNGTYGMGNVVSKRYDTKGLMAANNESQVWRFRGDQMIGTSGRNTDLLSTEYDSRTRWGAELHFIRGPFCFSSEWVHVRYGGLRVFHDFNQGAKSLKHQVLSFPSGWDRSGGIHNISAFLSWFITGESKFIDVFGWKQPNPLKPIGPGGGRGPGAFEVLARFSATFADKELFESTKVSGYATTDFTDPNNKLAGAAAGQGGGVTAALFEGAPTLYEVTVGLNWTMNYHLRVQLDYIYLYAPDYKLDEKGTASGGIVSAGNSELYDASRKSKQVKSEHALGLRLIIRL